MKTRIYFVLTFGITVLSVLYSCQGLEYSYAYDRQIQTCSSKAGVRDWLKKYQKRLESPRIKFRNGQKDYVDPKEKVRYLGKVLKCYVESFREIVNRKLELIFLIDSSSSIGKGNFINELKFVKKLLADFTVDQNNTRVSVVTFSNSDLVVRHIDHLLHPDDDHHKCSLLDGLHQMGESYRGGGTFTLGALREAQDVLAKARPSSKKVVFLITDGYSNYGNPIPVAEKLKQNDVEVFTFGIRNGNPKELLNMASPPQLEHTYILDSFEEFEALARRALHKDLHAGTYIKQVKDRCSKLCRGYDCCDEHALCACGTHTGKYECMCFPGYYGSGLKGECHACPEGSYKNYGGPGDITSCKRCPDPSHTSYPGSTSVRDCRCISGFTDTGQHTCAANTCPSLNPPAHGYFVRDSCNNVVHAACGIRCKPGYRLQGSSVRLCQENGTWTGTKSICTVKTCQKLKQPKYGHMMCSKDDFSFEAVCQFSCYSGFKLLGSKTRTCLAIAFWNGIPARCKEVRCKPLRDLTDGRVDPPTCTTRPSPFGTRCTFTCRAGYKMVGPYSKQCTEDGLWKPNDGTDNKCIDVAPPMLSCPIDIKVEADIDENTAQVNWDIPFTMDNSGYRPTLTSIPALEPPTRMPIGKTTMTYVVEDNNRNKKRCNFHITVIDTQPPRIDQCISPPTFIKKHHRDKPLLVEWDEPLFSDNSQEPLEIRKTHKPGEHFKLGQTEVVYTAIDRFNNNITCIINIIVKEHACANPVRPVNGGITCTTILKGLKCSLHCDAGYGFAIHPPKAYYCDFETGKWSPSAKYPFPDCSVSKMSNNVIKRTEMKFKSKETCENRELLNEIEQMIHEHVSKRVHKYCEPGVLCSVEEFTTDCIDADANEKEDNDIERLTNRIDESHGDPNVSKRRRRRDVRDEWYKESEQEEEYYDETEDLDVNSYYDYDYVPDLSKKKMVQVGFTIAGKLTQVQVVVGNIDTDQTKLKETVEDVSQKVKADLSAGQLENLLRGHELDFDDMEYVEIEPRFTCPLGSVLQNSTCVKCPVGTFFNVVHETCNACGLGTYQSSMGKNTCLVCPVLTSTSNNNSKDILECKGQCLPGSFSPDGLEICETCAVGFYQPEYASQSCIRCPHGLTTWRRGTRVVKKCGVACKSGYVSRTGLGPCYPCPRGYYQPDRGRSSCFKCPGDVKTQTLGSTSIKNCSGINEVSIVRFHNVPTSELSMNDCFKAPCKNNATCVKLMFGHVCNCEPGWTGLYCEMEILECASMPCENNATCTELMNGYNCSCANGFTGLNCQINRDDCMANSCYNNATCVDDVVGYHCLCATGYTGELCDDNIDDCAESPCGNGTCVDSIATFTCNCADGFSGQNCEVEVDECQSTPCYNNATCLDVIAAYKCHCVPGYFGKHCEGEIDECASTPCLNGATCFDEINGYTCRCAPSYKGITCEEKISSNFDLEFPSSSMTDYALLYRVFNNLTAISLGFWMKTSDNGGNYGTVISYANDEHANAFTMMDYTGFVLYINGQSEITNMVADDSRWHHLFVTWSSENGDWQLYRNGVSVYAGTGLAKGTTIKAGGALVLGQDQDSVGGDFSSQESFVGNISAVHMWDRNLTQEEIQALVWGCDYQIYGNIVAWSDFLDGIKGRVYKKTSEFCAGCVEPESIQNGMVVHNGLALKSQANYTCDTGFTLEGLSQRECLIDSTWSGSVPQCRRKKCGYPGSVQYASVGGYYFYNDTVSYTCHEGYRMDGNATLRCLATAEWDSGLPSCVEIKCKNPPFKPLLEMQYKRMSYSVDNVIKFKCRYGRLYGPDTLKCEKDGQWNYPFPSCNHMFCYQPPAILNGHTVMAKNEAAKVNSYVIYECDKGYVMTGVNTIQCLNNGSWSSFRPLCLINTCESPPNISKGYIHPVLTNYTYGSSIEYKCYSGYKVNGSSILQCMESGMWNGTFHTECIVKECNIPDSIENGYTEGDDEIYNIGSKVEYRCFKGYEIKVNATRYCLSDETWSGLQPICKPVECEKLPALDYGDINYENDPPIYNTKASLKCQDKYLIIGDSALVCNENSTWSGIIPYCIAKNCSIPTNPNYGRVTGNSYKIDDVIEYLCDAGYKITGEYSRIKCLADLTWEGTAPYCQEIECQKPIAIEFGGCISAPPYKPGKVIRYTCEKGFEIEGKDTRTCRIDGTWTGPHPKCKPIECKLPKNVSNGILVVEETIYGSTLEYVCDQGYEITGADKRSCNEDKDWTGSEPKCGRSQCPSPQTVTFGNIIGESHEVGSKITYECNKGYNLVGLSTLTCLLSKVWSGPAPSCNPIECIKPSSVISNGRMIDTDFTFGATVHYVCDSGYFSDGPTSRTCQADKSWDNTIPVCERVECARPLKPANCLIEGFDFRYKEHVSYACKNGYQLVGPIVRTCQVDKAWSGSEPKCIRIECPPPDKPVNGKLLLQGTFYQNEAKYQCFPGYWLIGEEKRVCQHDRTWSGDLPKCEHIVCGEPPLVDDTEQWQSDKPTAGQVVGYNCKPGYVLAEPSNLTCTVHGNYSGAIPRCVKVQCPDPENITNGITLKDSNDYGEAVRYVCQPGYNLLGVDLHKCIENGTWSGTVPECVKIECPIPDTVENGDVHVLDGYAYDKVIQYTCKAGYQIRENDERTCLADSTWSGIEPVCGELACTAPIITSGFVSESSGPGNIRDHVKELDLYVPGIMIYLDCEKGYELNGTNQLTCQKNQTWDDVIPTCVRVQCPVPKIEDANITATHGFVYSHKIIISCNSGYTLHGNSELYCSADKTWSKVLPECLPVTCEAPQFNNGNISVVSSPNRGVGYPFGLALRFHCYPGYTRLGAEISTCSETATWSPDIPICTQFKCNRPYISHFARYGQLHIIAPKESYYYTEIAEFGCNEGYEIEGISKLVCIGNESWSGKVPTCKKMECSKPAIANGKFSSGYTSYTPVVFKIGIRIVFQCFTGYQLVGTRNVSCISNKTWSAELPRCIAIVCPHPNINNSGIYPINEHYKFGDRITIYCQKGYELLGNSKFSCQKNGSWLGELPICSKIQCAEPDIENGMVENIKQEIPGRHVYYDVVRITCYSGFTIKGYSRLTCQLTGKWSPQPLPVCNPVSCITPPIPHGVAIIVEILNPHSDPSKSFVFGTIVNFECDKGYKLIGGNDSVCQEDGTWLNGVPDCEIVRCPSLNVSDGVVNSTYTNFGSVVSISCKSGFELFGDISVECGNTGKWQGLIPKCQAIFCVTPNIQHGKFTAKTGFQEQFRYGDSITASCDPGFYISGELELECLQNKTWSSPFLPTCERLSCVVQPSSIDNGIVTVNSKDDKSNSFETSLNFECNLGYELTGNSTLICQADRTWSSYFPKCTMLFCPSPYIVNGIVRGSQNRIDNFTFGDSVNFACDFGYSIAEGGEREIFCQPSRNWTAAFPVCDKITCGIPRSVEHGYINGSSYLFEDKVYFSCSYGYEVSGSSFSTCLGTGTWSEFPVCARVSCSLPPKIENGGYMSSGFKYEDKIKYECNEGYSMIGKAEHFCHGNKSWSGEAPKCVRSQCIGKFPSINNGQIVNDKEQYFYEDEINITCNNGFKLIGLDTVQCLANGQWSFIISTCVIVKCSYPITIQNGKRIYTSTEYNSDITYTCNDGYKLVGPAQRKCLVTGFWEGQAPVCEIVRCVEPKRSTFHHGFIVGMKYTYNYIIKYHCSSGYILQGEGEHVCQSNGIWSDSVPKCTPNDCKNPESIANGRISYSSTLYGSVAEYRCDEGYIIKGTTFRTCMSDKIWSGILPHCQKVSCPIPVEIDNGYYNGQDFTFNSQISYHCNDKYHLEGNKVMICGSNVRWKGTTPHCRIKKCFVPDNSLGDHVSMVGDDVTAGSTVTFQCDEGYQLIGNKELTCQDGEKWNGQFPQCDKVACGLPTLIENSVTDDNSYEYMDKVKFRCVKGYEIDGIAEIQCQANGKWSPIRAKCMPITCNKPTVIEHADYNGNSYKYGDYGFYKCHPGFDMLGNNLIQCGEDGFWEGKLPTCEMVTCGNVPVIPYASTIVEKTTYGSKAMYECNRGYQLIGSAVVQCIANGTWQYEDKPKCISTDCGEPRKLKNGKLRYTSSKLNATATYYCNEGFMLTGEKQVQCLQHGEWNYTIMPTCLPVSCSTPVDPVNGQVEGDSYEFGNQILYTCSVGYELIGDVVRTCLESGEWSGTKPKCQVIECNEPGTLINGEIILKGKIYQSVVYYICDNGYYLVGNETATCLEHGEWSSPLPTCLQSIIGVPCPPPQTLENMLSSEGGSYQVGDTIELNCLPGYTSTGDLTTVCQQDLTWTPPFGQCKKVSCGIPSKHKSVVIHGLSYNIGDMVKYYCRPGLAAMTPQMITCQSDGQWNHTPLCKAQCKFQCQNGGECVRRNKCKCKPGYGGRSCQQALCIMQCLNGGRCTAPYQCTCPEGFTGTRCEKPVCEGGCKNGGKCVRPNRCQCPHGFKPPFCDPYKKSDSKR